MSQAQDDALLIRRAQQGDRTAFDDLVRKHEVKAYQYAYRLTRNHEVAGDIVAEAFLRVHNALPNFRGQSAFSTWIYRILTNCYLDFKKRDRSRLHVSLDETVKLGSGEVERQIEDTSDGPEVLAEREAREGAVRAALQEMPEYQRAMLVMYHVEMLSYEQISEALDLPIGTVKSRLNRARLALRDQLGKDSELFQIG